MTKIIFLENLKNGLNGLPIDEIYERLDFYSEMIDDKIEDGLTEEKAISSLGSIDNIISEILKDYPFKKLLKNKIKPKKRLTTLEITLLILGSPIWFTILLSLIACFISVYISIWSIIISLWAVFIAFVGTAIGLFIFGIISLCLENVHTGVVAIAISLVLAGVSIFLFYGCIYVTKILILLAKKILLKIKKRFLKGGN